MSKLATTMEEMKSADLSVGKVINGVDNPNFLSVDSTTPIETPADEVKTEEGGEKKDESAKPAQEEKKPEVKADEKKPDKPEEKPAEKPVVKTDENDPVEKRIGKLTKKWRTAERERDFERTKRLELEKKIEDLENPKIERPKKEDFEDNADYLEALADWTEKALTGREKKTTAETKARVEEDAVNEVNKELAEMRDRGEDAYSDFETVVYSKELDLSEAMVEAALLTEIPEHILYYLGKNPDKSAEIAKLNPIQAAKEIGKLETIVAAGIPKPSDSQTGGEVKPDNAPPQDKKLTNTPEPIVPVKATGAVDKDPNTMSAKEYRAWREGNKG